MNSCSVSSALMKAFHRSWKQETKEARASAGGATNSEFKEMVTRGVGAVGDVIHTSLSHVSSDSLGMSWEKISALERKHA